MLLPLLAAGVALGAAPAPEALKVLLVTGGHDHDVSFYSALDGHDDLDVLVDPHPNAFRARVKAQVVVLYDMVPDLEPERRANLQAFVESGGGVVALHHALAGYTGWRWWSEEVVGGRYRHEPEDGHPASSYLHDVDLLVRPRRPHPKARVVCIQLGHGREAHLNPTYRRLARNAVLWAGRRLGD